MIGSAVGSMALAGFGETASGEGSQTARAGAPETVSDSPSGGYEDCDQRVGDEAVSVFLVDHAGLTSSTAVRGTVCITVRIHSSGMSVRSSLRARRPRAGRVLVGLSSASLAASKAWLSPSRVAISVPKRNPMSRSAELRLRIDAAGSPGNDRRLGQLPACPGHDLGEHAPRAGPHGSGSGGRPSSGRCPKRRRSRSMLVSGSRVSISMPISMTIKRLRSASLRRTSSAAISAIPPSRPGFRRGPRALHPSRFVRSGCRRSSRSSERSGSRRSTPPAGRPGSPRCPERRQGT